MTLLGTADIDCRLLDAALALPERSFGDNDGEIDREESDPERLRETKSAPRWLDKLPGVLVRDIPGPPLL